MRGTAEELSKHSFSHIRDRLTRNALEDLHLFLFESQFVDATAMQVDSTVWKVTAGSGMGQISSGDAADATFSEEVERDLVVVLQRPGILRYYKYRDDILIIAIDRPQDYISSATSGQSGADIH